MANVAQGTDIIFFVTDAENNQGGSTQILRVGQSGNATCLDDNSPASSTSHAPTMTATSHTFPSSTGTLKPTILVPAIVAPVVAVIGIVLGALLYCRRRRRRNSGVRVLGRESRKPEVDLMKGDADTSSETMEVGSPSSTDPFMHHRSPSSDGVTGSYQSPWLPTPAASDSQYGTIAARSPYPRNSSRMVSAPGRPEAAHANRQVNVSGPKTAEANVLAPPGHHPSTQFILHTDIEDDPSPPIHEVIELPPQYSERRPAPAALSGLDAQFHGTPSGDMPDTVDSSPKA